MNTIDFSAFSVHERNITPEKWVLILGAAFLVSLFGSLLTGGEAGEIVLTLTLVVYGLGWAVAVALLFIWFIRQVLWRQWSDLQSGRPGALIYTPEGAVTALLHFCEANGFNYKEYPTETIAPDGMSLPIVKKCDDLFTYVLFEITGKYNGMDFSYYCLASEAHPAVGSGPSHYAYSSRGKRLFYTTVISVNRPLTPRYKGAVQVRNLPNGYVYCDGFASDRRTVQKLFAQLESRRG